MVDHQSNAVIIDIKNLARSSLQDFSLTISRSRTAYKFCRTIINHQPALGLTDFPTSSAFCLQVGFPKWSEWNYRNVNSNMRSAISP